MDHLHVSIPPNSSDWYLSLTPPYSPGNVTHKLLTEAKDHDDSYSFPSPASPPKMAVSSRFAPSVPCCKRHEKCPERPLDSEGSLIHEECVGSFTCGQEIEIPLWAVGMTGRELELRLQIAEIQKMYKVQQKEFNKMKRSTRKVKQKRKLKIKRRKKEIEVQNDETKTEVIHELSGASETFQIDEPPICNEQLASEACHSSVTNGSDFIDSPCLKADELIDGCRLMVLQGGLFYPGQLQVLDADALIYTVNVDGQRSNRPYVLCQEELLSDGMKEIFVTDVSQVPVGCRVCALWSGQIQALYPGTVESNEMGYSKKGEPLININFDDGDSGQIPLSDVRLLPSQFPITKVSSSVLPEFITRRRKSRDTNLLFPEFPHPKPVRKRTRDDTRLSEPEPLPEWQWASDPVPDSKRKTDSYQSIKRGDLIVQVGDLVHLQHGSITRNTETPFVAVVESFWQARNKSKRMRVAWCYRAHEVNTKMALPPADVPHVLFRSSHYDDNSIQTIMDKCNLVTLSELRRRRDKAPSTVRNAYFMAGNYDPVTNQLNWVID